SSLGDESRTCEPSHRSGLIDLINKRLIERNVDPDRPSSISKQRNGKQHCAGIDRCFYILVTQHPVHSSRSRQFPSSAFKSFHVLTKSHCRIRDRFFQSVA